MNPRKLHQVTKKIFPHNSEPEYPPHDSPEELVNKFADLFCDKIMKIGKCVFLVLLDFSATFDTINHTILLQCLENYLGITGNVLSWFHSYLANRKQSVHLLGTSSRPRDLDYGVLQGSVLGPFYFSVYWLPHRKIITAHHGGTKYHFWTDHSRSYILSLNLWKQVLQMTTWNL